MKKLFSVLCTTILILISQSGSGQTLTKESISGSWIGKIKNGALELRVIFNLSIIEKDSLVAILDSPDQGAKGIKLGPVTFTGESIKISAGALLAEYNGRIVSDTLIEGSWKQGPNTIELNLNKLEKVFTLKRPQEPRPPFPYKAEDVIFHNSDFDIDLAGTFTIPEGDGPFPTVILITGSGAQNRDEELLGHKPFLVISDYLTRNGIAVLRYDDRGVGKSKGNYVSATSADLATDCEAAISFLKQRPEVDKKRIGLIGHSEGGLIAPIVASSSNDVAFIVSLAGPGVIGEELISRQSADISRLSGISEKQINESQSANKKLFAILKKEADNDRASEMMIEKYRKILQKRKSPPDEIEKEVNKIEAGLRPASLTWFRYFISTDPSVYWKKVHCPVLALNGAKDLQVAAEINLPAIEKALKSAGNKSVKTVELPDLNHLFQHCKTGLPAEYNTIEETFSPEALRLMADWIVDQ